MIPVVANSVPNSRGEKIAQLSAWREWKTLCALDLCARKTQALLHDFAGLHSRAYLRRYAGMTNIRNSETVARSTIAVDMWHLFETHLRTENTKAGKRYKDWLFARIGKPSESALQTIEGGASLIMRDVVRHHLRKEFARHGTVCLQDGVMAEVRADQLLAVPSPVDEVAHREYEALAAQHAAAVFVEMTHRERIALLCRQTGLALSHPTAEQAAQCRKSALHSTYVAFCEKTAKSMKASYPDDDPESVVGLTLMLIHAIKGRVVEWARTETSCALLLGLAEES